MSFDPFALPLSLVAATPAAGYALQNAGPVTIWQWTAPNDGQQHVAMVLYSFNCTLATTGGAFVWQFTNPAGAVQAPTLVAGTQAAGTKHGTDGGIIEAGTTVSLLQNSAMTAGAATVWGSLWAA